MLVPGHKAIRGNKIVDDLANIGSSETHNMVNILYAVSLDTV